MSDIPGMPVSDFHRLDMGKIKAAHISELPEDTYQSLMKGMQSFLAHKYTRHPDTAANPAYKEYARVVVNGKTIAKIDNHGFVESSKAIGAKLHGKLPDIDQTNGKDGPRLAQLRAEFIARTLGGKVEKSATALTEAQFRAIPPPRFTVDTDRMKSDPLFAQIQKTQEARALFLARQLAEGGI